MEAFLVNFGGKDMQHIFNIFQYVETDRCLFLTMSSKH